MSFFKYRKYLLFLALLIVVLSFPLIFAQKVRLSFLCMFSPLWRSLDSSLSAASGPEKEKIARLEIENHLLHLEVGKYKAMLEDKSGHGQENFPLNLYEKSGYLLEPGVLSICARIIYRDAGSWTSSAWVNVGEETNKLFGKKIIQKNSPVLLGKCVVGVVDHVGKKQSRIRLITDAALTPSVRAIRGKLQNLVLQEPIESLLRHLKTRSDLNTTPILVKELNDLKQRILPEIQSWHLAKGILQGSGTPFYRSFNHTLRGIGFNYDFSDKKGPARELISEKGGVNGGPIIKQGDILITTGMDGVFPEGLLIAQVTRIYPLKEGAYTYDIEAEPLAGNLDDLRSVYIISPLGYNQEEVDYEHQ